MADLETYYKDLVAGKRRTAADRLLLWVLTGCAWIYGILMQLRAAAYRSRIFRVHRLHRPVIAVGNLAAGGTGKTPTVLWLARYLMARGKRVAVLSRGYGGSLAGAVRLVSDGARLLATPEEAGDEPVLLARSCAGLIVVVGADRYQAGLLAQEKLNPDVFILDDSFQHMKLYRDLNILLLDCANPFGNGRTFPAGLLREPESAVQRADLIFFTRCKPGMQVPSIAGQPFCCSNHELLGFVSLMGGETRPFDDLRGKRGLAFAGIADPAGFFDCLEQAGLRPVATLAFPDHICYGDDEISALCRLTAASRSEYLITTEKDAVKLQAHHSRLGTVLVAPLGLRFSDTTVIEAKLSDLFNGQRL